MTAGEFKPATALSAWCDRFIELGWTAALVVAPLFFNIYSSRVFEPDKITTVRSIALVMAAAWLVKWLEQRNSPGSDRVITWRTPLVLPTLIMVVVYMISTALSVAPRTSLLGSYQRLQGTYSTLSYIIVFLLMLQGMRTRAQLNRMVNVLIINSLPIALYGIAQRYGLDPLPWGGDTSQRVAGNMGNAIFIAAYLIMAFFLTMGKIAEAFLNVMAAATANTADVIRSACYILIAILNAVVVLVLAGSRGPQLGWLAGLFFMVVLLFQMLRNRRVRLIGTLATIGLGVAGVSALIVLNLGQGPLVDRLRGLPVLGRLSTAFSTSEGTNLVRALIWDGNVEMMTSTAPLEFPDGSLDPYYPVRDLFGYGPESMYVAYNRFYPPALANVEARNASPDRSHNETWDSIVITGLVGFVAYMFVFGAALFWGFRWIGLIASRFERFLFPILWAGGALAGGIGAAVLVKPGLLGVGVGLGAALGLTLFLVVSAVLNSLGRAGREERTALSLGDQVLAIGLISAIVAHFIEIHLGIAIAATRTHFWGFLALLAVIGMQWVQGGASEPSEPAEAQTAQPDAKQIAAVAASGGTRRQRAKQRGEVGRSAPVRQASAGASLPGWFNSVLVSGLLLGMVLAVMSYDFTTNPDRLMVPGQVFMQTLTALRGVTSFGILAIFLVTWVAGSLILVLDAQRSPGSDMPADDMGASVAAIGLVLSVSLVIWVTFGTFVAGRLVAFIATPQPGVEGILTIAEQLSYLPGYVYLILLFVMGVGASLLVKTEARPRPKATLTVGGFAVLLVLLVLTPISASASNLQSIRADIIYKQANPWDSQAATVLQQNTNFQGWDLGIEHHRRAIQLAPNEDFYYLWLGRGLLEKAKTTRSTAPQTLDEAQITLCGVTSEAAPTWQRTLQRPLPSADFGREDLLAEAKCVLEEARRINPLNTDHSANLARMYRQSGDITQDPVQKRQRYEASSQQYRVATMLSPQNAQLVNEWATLYMYSLADPVTARAKIDQSLTIDQKFDQTYLLRGDFARIEADPLLQQREQYAADLRTVPATDTVRTGQLTALVASANQAYRGKMQAARVEFEKALELNPNNGQAYNILTFVDQQLGDLQGAISVTQRLLEVSPSDWNAWKNLAVLMRDTGNSAGARDAAQRAVEFAPADQRAALQAFIAQLKP